jgi:hypothetical protein
MSACRSCGAALIWAKTTAGRIIPVDAEPVTDGKGNILLDGSGKVRMAIVGRVGSGTHRAHFVSCPNANQHRKERRQ